MRANTKLNTENKVILLFNSRTNSWEDKSESIASMYKAFYYGNHSGYNIHFKESGKFFYRIEKVRILNKLKTIDVAKKDVYVNANLVSVSSVDFFEDGYFGINTKNGTIFTKDVSIEDAEYKDIFNYYCSLAEYAGTICEQDSPLYFLSQNYKGVEFQHSSVLYDFFKSQYRSSEDNELLLIPFDSNKSQIKAISTALKNNISLIEGPPGTGKTQTILNLIANLIYRNETCAVVSNNNTAIENVYEKLNEENLSFISASLGKKQNVDEFFETNHKDELYEFLKKEIKPANEISREIFQEYSLKLKEIQEVEIDTFLLKSKLIDIENEQRHFDSIFTEPSMLNLKFDSSVYMKLIIRLESQKKFGFFERLIFKWKYKIKINKEDINKLLNSVEKLYYQTKIKELKSKILINEEILKISNKNFIEKRLKELSLDFLENHIKNNFIKKEINDFNKKTYKKDYRDFLSRYPVILSTTQSLVNNIPNGFKFDYLIIDEASQCNLLSSVLAMNCARNLVVIGDSKQLQQIDEESLFFKSEELANKFNVPKYFHYETNSLLKSAKNSIKNIPTTLLREHYRCAPDIINFCNKMFYDNQLIAMTKNAGRHIEIIKTVAGNHARKNPYGTGLYNQREIDEIANIISTSKSNDIGVITPFRYQANLIDEELGSNRVEADTIHKFQGRQKDEIILSFVVNSLDKQTGIVENKLNDFVTDPKLLNVAISRGKNKIYAIVSDKVYYSSNNTISDFIKYSEYLYGSSATTESKVISVFDCLYSEHNNALLLKYKRKPGEYETELIISKLIEDILQEYSYIGYSMHVRLSKLIKTLSGFSEEEKKYILHPWSHVDFLFFNKVSKEPLFVLEVDGIRYHEQSKKQTEHDDIKNRALKMNNMPIYRFKTNESSEKQRLLNIINQFSH